MHSDAWRRRGGHPDALDLLVVIDTSSSQMAAHQARLAEALPELFRRLATRQVRRIRVGVLTTDLGTGGPIDDRCRPYDFGDDAVIQTASPECGPAELTVELRAFAADDADRELARLADAVGCVVRAGSEGCTVRQPLEVVLKALTPSTSNLRFHRNTVGHGDGANDGFNAADAVLAVVLLTDGDDCSTREPRLHDADDDTYEGEPALRCALHSPEAYAARGLDPRQAPVWGIERFVDGLLQVRGDPRDLVFVAITGVPSGSGDDPSRAPDYDAILADPRMQPRADPADPTQLAPVCSTRVELPDGTNQFARAAPAPRLVGAARRLEREHAHVSLRSICDDGIAAALAEAIARPLTDWQCYPAPVPRDPSGRVPCELYAHLGEGGRCEDWPGHTYVRSDLIDGVPRAICRVHQRAVIDGVLESAEGWAFVTADDDPHVGRVCGPDRPQRIVGPDLWSSAGWYGFGCLRHVGTTACDRDCRGGGEPVSAQRHRHPLECDLASNTCRAPCEADEDCGGGHVCAETGAGLFCVDPSCGP